jgi:putative pyruvate formate lyase activating enzyme
MMDGEYASVEDLAAIMLALERSGGHNINFVTPTHQMPMILEALAIAAPDGLGVPLVYNCGGYESLESLSLLDGIVDIYMPDLKYTGEAAASELSDAPDYLEKAKAAIREMHRQVGDLDVDGRGIARRGLLVRHLVLPEGLAGTEEAMRFLAEEISKDTYINVMDQYRPCHDAYTNPAVSRRITRGEYKEAVNAARAAGLHRLSGIFD